MEFCSTEELISEELSVEEVTFSVPLELPVWLEKVGFFFIISVLFPV